MACKELNLTGEAGATLLTTIVKILYCLLLPVCICPSSRVSSNSKNVKSTVECLALFPLSCVQWCFILGL